MADARQVRVVIENERYRVVGDVTMPAEGYKSRLSDLLNRDGVEFIAMTDVTLATRNGAEPEHHSFLAVARDHIQVAYEGE